MVVVVGGQALLDLKQLLVGDVHIERNAAEIVRIGDGDIDRRRGPVRFVVLILLVEYRKEAAAGFLGVVGVPLGQLVHLDVKIDVDRVFVHHDLTGLLLGEGEAASHQEQQSGKKHGKALFHRDITSSIRLLLNQDSLPSA